MTLTAPLSEIQRIQGQVVRIVPTTVHSALADSGVASAVSDQGLAGDGAGTRTDDDGHACPSSSPI